MDSEIYWESKNEHFAWEALQKSKCSIEENTIVTATDFALVLCGFGSSFGIKKPPKLMPRRDKKKTANFGRFQGAQRHKNKKSYGRFGVENLSNWNHRRPHFCGPSFECIGKAFENDSGWVLRVAGKAKMSISRGRCYKNRSVALRKIQ